MLARASPKRNRFRTETHHRVSGRQCHPFGYVCHCNRPYFKQILSLVENCQAYLPFLTFSSVSTITTNSSYQKCLDQQFPALHSLDISATRPYSYVESQTKQLQELSRQLSSVARIKKEFTKRINNHDNLPSDNLALIVLRNLEMLLEEVQSKKTSIDTAWWQLLDRYPLKVEDLLTGLMNDIRNSPESFWKTLPNISYRDFQTLGVGRWLNDEIINHFIEKWCSESRNTLGFGTFFAGSCLFEDKASCLVAKEYLTLEDEQKVRRCVIRRQNMLALESWDSVFIPIHEGSSHWYSVRIDFILRRIDIYDSLQETCLVNRSKPIPLRKNTNLMLVLMWLTEILASMRGEPVVLENNLQCDWICDPHSKVPFQPNPYDCGVHTLWHLKHILEYREVMVGPQSNKDGLSFTNNMVGKRLRLAQELLEDAAL
ncbi:hypothetical protein F5878DRAFT_667182 [Lentinula raphanica]|uniref:Ubiquitin-like protease family profile domain-containing protein n=1 Tax=Lentinula raphanica TaxID=153919 RepID=A0AA38NW92_9AGAR|nr:hypothetical protein F5878DRAFT_667182 [Lentinula raphanica]